MITATGKKIDKPRQAAKAPGVRSDTELGKSVDGESAFETERTSRTNAGLARSVGGGSAGETDSASRNNARSAKTVGGERAFGTDSSLRNNAGLVKLTRLGASSRAMQVVEQLTQLILDGEFKQDELLPPERELASRLGVSRNILREATKILQSRGLLSIRHGIGTIVSAPGSEGMQHTLSHALHGQKDALNKLMEVRLAVEVQIASLAAKRAEPEQLQKLRGILAEMLECLNDPQRYVELDLAFHLTLAECTQNNLFAVVLEGFTALSQQARMVVLKSGFPVDTSQRIHQQIFQAVEKGDSKLAGQLMEIHLRTANENIDHIFKAKELRIRR